MIHVSADAHPPDLLMTTTHESRLDPILEHLQIPSDFSRYERFVETRIITSLEQWKQGTETCLSELRDLVVLKGSRFSIQDQALVISTVSPFDGEGSWITNTARKISGGA
jgi:hypothetical protein